jgi:hypothetical protein
LQLANQILLLDPEHERIQVNKKGYEQILHEKADDEVEETPVIENESNYYNEFIDEYKSLCRYVDRLLK